MGGSAGAGDRYRESMAMPSEVKSRAGKLEERIVSIIVFGALWFCMGSIALVVLITILTGNDPTAH